MTIPLRRMLLAKVFSSCSSHRLLTCLYNLEFMSDLCCARSFAAKEWMCFTVVCVKD